MTFFFFFFGLQLVFRKVPPLFPNSGSAPDVHMVSVLADMLCDVLLTPSHAQFSSHVAIHLTVVMSKIITCNITIVYNQKITSFVHVAH